MLAKGADWWSSDDPIPKGKHYEINIAIWDVTGKQLDAILDRVEDSVCAEDHKPDGPCPYLWTASGKIVEDEDE